MNIRVLVARSLTYLLLLLTLAGVYGLAVFGASSLIFNDATPRTTQNIIYVILAVVLAFTFQPLRRFFENVTTKIFYKDRYDSQEVLNDITHILATEFKLQSLLDLSIEKLCASIHVEWGQLIVFEKGQIYKLAHCGRLPEKLITPPELKDLGRRKSRITDEMAEGDAKEILVRHNIRAFFPMTTKEQFAGFLLLGDKLSGDIFSNQDIELLEILAGELAVAITNAKAYEEIEQFNLTLQKKVKEATAELRNANVHLKELDKAKDDFISMASHQLRTPLTTIKGYVSMIEEGDAGKVNTQQHEFLKNALTGSERMGKMIMELLNVSRMSTGKFKIEPKPVDLAEVVSEEVDQLKLHASAKGIQLIYNPPKGPVNCEIDEDKTRQVIMNFIDNAIYYTKQGSVTVGLEPEDGKVKLTVVDTGIGVPKAAIPKLFSKFYRADNAKVARPDGTGLGLFLAKRVVEEQGGKIIFATQEGKGSTFGFELPVKVKPQAATTKIAVAAA